MIDDRSSAAPHLPEGNGFLALQALSAEWTRYSIASGDSRFRTWQMVIKSNGEIEA
ncbi:MAG TPA: hypothetical protein VF669_07330 [Tepidisphaeraceae bacterium]